MNWEDEGYLLSKKKFRENENLINVFTLKYGKISGIVYGGLSRKKKNYLQIINKLFLNYSTKNINRIGYFKTELIEPISPKYFNDKKRTAALLSIGSILTSLLPEAQVHKKIYVSLSELLKSFNNDNWIFLYIFWELKIIRELGYGFESDMKLKKIKDDDLTIFDIDGVRYSVPPYILKNELPIKINNDMIKNSLIFTRSILLNKFFIPNNIYFPQSRILLEKYFN